MAHDHEQFMAAMHEVRAYGREAHEDDLAVTLVLEGAPVDQAKTRIDDARGQVLLAWFAVPTFTRGDEVR